MSRDLFDAALAVMKHAHAPYSRFPVGAAIRASDGRIFAGCNVENASYPEGVCAETAAMAQMVSVGAREIRELALVAEKRPLITPCGGCRQRLSEFAGPETPVHLCDAEGVRETVTLGDLLPRGFDATSLGEPSKPAERKKPRRARSGDMAVARRALALLDLTDLTETCTAEDIDRLCVAAVTDHGPVAAVCVWPRFVRQCVLRLADSGVRVAAVANFPDGAPETAPAIDEIERIFADGADEVDLVIPWRALQAGDAKPAKQMLAAARRATPAGGGLKAILETGALAEPKLIRQAAKLALAADVDFLKTSTGKTPIGATEQAAEILLEEIRRARKPAGFKASGGVRTAEDAARYLAIADRIMGKGWANSERFRFGASGLLNDLLVRLEGGSAGSSNEGY